MSLLAGLGWNALRTYGTVTELQFTANPVFADGTIADGFYLHVGALPG
ncbi:hypothetical protein [Streptomyces sp.]|nr:hypothetical protein [Streptomyces sp.]HET6354259.1 hypothetical protein [Streptomyces sp.]